VAVATEYVTGEILRARERVGDKRVGVWVREN
jgi:hypothetical protein